MLLIFNMKKNRKFLIVKINKLGLHFRHEKIFTGGIGGKNAVFESAATLIVVLDCDIGEYAHCPRRKSGIQIRKEYQIFSAKFRQLLFDSHEDIVKIPVDNTLKLYDAV